LFIVEETRLSMSLDDDICDDEEDDEEVEGGGGGGKFALTAGLLWAGLGTAAAAAGAVDNGGLSPLPTGGFNPKAFTLSPDPTPRTSIN
jgi:hypothetical protein